jgi:hypothetical protein
MFAYIKTINHCPATDPFCESFERVYDQDKKPFQNLWLMIFDHFHHYELNSDIQMFVFVCWTFIIPFIMMNLLIAFVAETYATFVEKRETAKFRELADLIMDLELIMWGKSDKKEQKFLSFVRKAKDEYHDLQSRVGIGSKIMNLSEKIDKEMKIVKKDQETLKLGLDKKIDGITAKLDILLKRQ